MARSSRKRNEWTLSLLDIQPDDRIREVGCDPGALTSRPPCCSRLQSATPRPSGKGGCDWREAPPRLSPLKMSHLQLLSEARRLLVAEGACAW